jgi:ADP-ribose pyrophosphatase YjhB (NUDIX family)
MQLAKVDFSAPEDAVTRNESMLKGIRARLEGISHRLSRIVTLGAQGIVVDPDRRVLLVRHTYKPGWHFPGGGVRRGETVRQALARELEEEASVGLTDEPKLVGIYSQFDDFPGDHIVLYLVDAWTQTRPVRRNLEIAEQQFYTLDNLPSGTTQGTSRRLREVFAGAAQQRSW